MTDPVDTAHESTGDVDAAERPDTEPAGVEHEPVDPDELVGPGKFALRVQPAAAIAPGTTDAKRLLTVWFIKKSFYWLFFFGLGIGWSVTIARNNDDVDLDVDWLHPSTIVGPWMLLILALALRFIVGWIALALAAPLVLAHEPNLSPRTNFGSSIGVFFDRLNVARAFRSLRWTHHVREVAKHRLGRTGERLGKLDPILDIVNITAGVLAILVPIVVAVATGSGS